MDESKVGLYEPTQALFAEMRAPCDLRKRLLMIRRIFGR